MTTTGSGGAHDYDNSSYVMITIIMNSTPNSLAYVPVCRHIGCACEPIILSTLFQQPEPHRWRVRPSGARATGFLTRHLTASRLNRHHGQLPGCSARDTTAVCRCLSPGPMGGLRRGAAKTKIQYNICHNMIEYIRVCMMHMHMCATSIGQYRGSRHFPRWCLQKSCAFSA